MPWYLRPAACLIVTAALALPAAAEDHFLTIGGGYSPMGNQVSLEKNVLLFRKLLSEAYPSAPAHDIFFADGDDAGRDLQYHDPTAPTPRSNQLAAQVFQEEKYYGYQYRSSSIPGLSGASNEHNVKQWFEETGAKLTGEDRLIIYLTAHGGKATDKKQPRNTSVYLWNRQRMVMTDLVGLLDKVPADVPVMVVMVQCYSGGFANIVFNEGDRKKGFTQANRCGFYATLHNRVAAGCTADIREEDYHEYSSYFWEAIRGSTRTGQPIERPDYDGDGRTSFAEAHAYALMESITLDISIKTSDAFLRAFSKLGDGKDDLLHAGSPVDQLLAEASPVDRAVIEGLSQRLSLNDQQRAEEAKKLAGALMSKKKQFDDDRKQKHREYTGICRELQNHLKQRWPEIANKWHPRMTELLTTDSEEFVKAIEGHRRYDDFERLHDEMEQLSEQKFDLDRRWVKCQRLIRTLENVAYAANLPRVADDATQQRFAELLASEAGFLGTPKANVQVAAE